MDTVDLSVVMVTQNGAEALPKALSHLEQQSHPAARYEVVIVDWSSTDKTPEVLTRHAAGSPVRIKTLQSNAATLGAARNLAVQQAQGRWILFLDGDLLASPRLVEHHIRLQSQHGGFCMVVGKVEQHPQIQRKTMLRHYGNFATTPIHNQPLRFVDWRCWNLSAPRSALLEVRGFDDSFEIPGLDDVEMAWRLERCGLQGFFSDQAAAYAWMPVTVEQELARRYAEGFTLRRVLDKTQSEVLAYRYLGTGSASRRGGRVFAPAYHHLCKAVAKRVRPFEWLCRRMSKYAVIQGFRDASRGQSPRYRIGPSLCS